ncbi:TPA: response regulator transcription factor LtdR [Streptococcus agalactiae]|uniref:response regulator transcription factor LtdR n=1 Tax=Streptococcus agalactiae TaxID=1311 RepID=UPI0002822D1D|nr:response regulator transcription factor LtdR [Streptococcus agalactiae]EJZ02776.1 DNA-binding response regulator [Streptococcus agalactiae STIR-CD-17]EPU02858.1 LytR family transcriptional regulator [Streptococcus agalactiae STIR-CD-13]EPU05971.1 LytR family transcriptional regulator [Streptococcus agalactiae STIR-CD-09]EPU19888.1 LytR family transcriptional regulator [Streptococcus agalactiae LMG 14609]EPU37016.1 LytR family transcriptional regulator [Streptococcus agalactiae MRI Z1-039]E
MKVLVVDDEPVARNELIYLLNKYDSNLVIAEAHDMATALAILLRETFDVALLDIHLRDDSGLQLAEYINKMPKPPLLIFATAYDQYAIQAFEQDARDYLLKPYEFDRLKQAMDRVKGALSTSTIIESVTSGPLFKQQYPLTVEDRIYLVSADDILLIEAMQGKLIIQTPDKNYEIDGSLQQWQDKLPSSQFVRVHRSYIVNINAIKTIEPWFNQTLQLHLCNKITVPVSRANVKPLKQMLGIST